MPASGKPKTVAETPGVVSSLIGGIGTVKTPLNRQYMGVSKNRATPKWTVYSGQAY